MDAEPTTTQITVPTDLTADEVIAKIDELVNLAHFLKRVAKPMVRRYSKKRASTSTTAKRNGFAMPVTLHETLVQFLNKNAGKDFTTTTEVPRTEVTSAMTTYIKSKDLQLPENRKNFRMDEELAHVFGQEVNTVSNWFEMQKYLKHIITSVKKQSSDDATASAAAAPAAAAPAAAAPAEPQAPAPSAVKPLAKRIKRG